jgi:hypothetical protein
MTPAVTLTRAMSDPQLFGKVFASPSFWTWKVVAKLIDGIPLTEPREIDLFEQCTGRSYNKAARQAVRCLIMLAGRRAGKDRFEKRRCCLARRIVLRLAQVPIRRSGRGRHPARCCGQEAGRYPAQLLQGPAAVTTTGARGCARGKSNLFKSTSPLERKATWLFRKGGFGARFGCW